MSKKTQSVLKSLTAFLLFAAIIMVAVKLFIGAPAPDVDQGQAAEVVKSPKHIPVPYDGTPNRIVPEHVSSAQWPDLPDDASDSQIANSRIFPTQLFPVRLSGGGDDLADNAAAAGLLRQLRELSKKDRFVALEKWLQENADSRWAPALKHELYSYRHERGYFAKAREGWQGLWAQIKSKKGENARQLGNEILSRLLDTNISIARAPSLRKLLAESQGRLLGGALEGKLFRAREAVFLLEHTGSQNIMCGPLALNSVTHYLGKRLNPPRLSKVTPDYIDSGLPLNELESYAKDSYGIPAIMARRVEEGAALPTPSVAHLSEEHYIAVLQRSEDGTEYFIEDKTLDFNGWVDKEAVEETASGYFLVASNQLPVGYKKITVSEARNVFGRDGAHGVDKTGDSLTDDNCQKGKGCGDSYYGMPTYSFHPLPAAVRIGDIPLGYTPPIGPAVNFRINYNDLDDSRPPSASPFSDVGLTWSTDWVSWVKHKDGPIAIGMTIDVMLPGGGRQQAEYKNDGQNNPIPVPNPKNFAVLERTGTHTYTRTFPNGSKRVYNTPDTATGTPDKVFLTKIVDPSGNALTFGYDSNMRLTSVTDAIGQVTTVSYGLVAPHDHKITTVKDPFNREANLQYDSSGQLISVTDQIGLTSSFTYAADGFIKTIKTPYGTTTFRKSGLDTGNVSHRWVEATDPQGDAQRMEFADINSGPLIPPVNEPAESIDVGGTTVPMHWGSQGLKFRNSFYWSKEAWHHHPNDYAAAEITHWYTEANWYVAPHVQASKKSGEDWVWYNYKGSKANGNLDTNDGGRPTKVLQMRKDGSARLVQTEYNDFGQVTKSIDAVGRETQYIYFSNGLDLKEVKQKREIVPATTPPSYTYDLLFSATYYDAVLYPHLIHKPHIVKDAAGRATTYTYNARGQVETVSQYFSPTVTYVTTYSYDSNGYLQSVDGPLAGTTDTTSFGYDTLGRMNSVTTPDSYTVTMEYDAFDRVEKVTFPDNTYTENVYDRLSLASSRDRLGRVTRYAYNSLQQLVKVTDPLNKVTTYEWCRCGDLRKLIDALGKVTQWQYDSQSRKIKKTYPDNSTESYKYDPSTGELVTVTGRNGQLTTYNYHHDGRLASTSHSSTDADVAPAAGVSFTYDANYGRLLTMVDQVGTTTYGYHPVALNQNGAGALASIDGPWANDTITYDYDTLGRLKDRKVDNVSFGTNLTYDAMGRLTHATNALGLFTNTYDGVTSRVTNVAYPNGMNIAMSYGTAAQDFRLQEIHNKLSGGATASKFNYTHDVNGQIKTLTRQLATGTTDFAYGYDRTYQLTSALLSQAGSATKHYSYSYDSSGNRTSKQVDANVSTASHNSLNQLTSMAGGGLTRFYGTVDEPSDVTVGGVDATVDANNKFEAFLDLATGTHSVTIQATDGQSNTSSKTYTVTIPTQTPESFTYDASGNMETHTANGKTRVYAWDSLGRLVSIQSDQTPVSGSWRTEFTYNGSGQRVARKEFSHNGTTWVAGDSVTYLWAGGNQPAQQRDATGATVTRHYFGNGFAEPDGSGGLTKYYQTKDHLGSTREIVDSAGTVIETVYDYTPYGEVEVIQSTSGNIRSDMLYTGHLYHEPSKLHLTLFRAYDPDLGRWLSPDPIKEDGGLNLYAYVSNNPVNYVDFLGLEDTLAPGPHANGSIPARGPERNFTRAERDAINKIGKCHTCGCSSPGTKSGDFVPDHQPPNALAKKGQKQRLYPHCKSCSGRQAGQVTQHKRRLKMKRAGRTAALGGILGMLGATKLNQMDARAFHQDAMAFILRGNIGDLNDAVNRVTSHAGAMGLHMEKALIEAHHKYHETLKKTNCP